MSTAAVNGAAGDAEVQTGPAEADAVQAQRELYALEAEQAVETIKAKAEGMYQSLKTAKAEAKRLRAEADEGAEG